MIGTILGRLEERQSKAIEQRNRIGLGIDGGALQGAELYLRTHVDKAASGLR